MACLLPPVRPARDRAMERTPPRGRSPRGTAAGRGFREAGRRAAWRTGTRRHAGSVHGATGRPSEKRPSHVAAADPGRRDRVRGFSQFRTGRWQAQRCAGSRSRSNPGPRRWPATGRLAGRGSRDGRSRLQAPSPRQPARDSRLDRLGGRRHRGFQLRPGVARRAARGRNRPDRSPAAATRSRSAARESRSVRRWLSSRIGDAGPCAPGAPAGPEAEPARREGDVVHHHQHRGGLTIPCAGRRSATGSPLRFMKVSGRARSELAGAEPDHRLLPQRRPEPPADPAAARGGENPLHDEKPGIVPGSLVPGPGIAQAHDQPDAGPPAGSGQDEFLAALAGLVSPSRRLAALSGLAALVGLAACRPCPSWPPRPPGPPRPPPPPPTATTSSFCLPATVTTTRSAESCTWIGRRAPGGRGRGWSRRGRGARRRP